MTKTEILNIDTTTALMSINQLKESIKQLKQELGQLTIGSQQYEDTSKKLITTQNNLKKAQDLSKASMDNFSNSIFGMQTRLNNARRALYQMNTTDPGFKKKSDEVKQLSALLNKARIAAGDFSNNIGNYRSGFAAFGTTLKGLSGSLLGFSTGVGAAVAALRLFGKLIGNVVESNKTFESQSARLAAILGKTTQQFRSAYDGAKDADEEMSNLISTARQLGAQTLYTADEVAQLQTELAKLGFNSDQIVKAQKAVLNFALATGSDLPAAAALAGATIRAFNMDASETTRVLDAMAKATTASALDFHKLETAMPIVASVAHQLGFEIEDVLAVLAQLSNVGMDASMSATATRNILLSLADSNSKLSKALGKPVHSAKELTEGLKKLNEQGISLGEIFDLSDKRSVAALSALIDASGEAKDSINKLKAELDEAGGSMQKMADVQVKTLSGLVTILQSAWNDLMLSFKESTGPLATVVGGLTKVINKLKEVKEGRWTTDDKADAQTSQDWFEGNVKKYDERYQEQINAVLASQGKAALDLKNIYNMSSEELSNLSAAAEQVAKNSTDNITNLNNVLGETDGKLKELGGRIDDVNKEMVKEVLKGNPLGAGELALGKNKLFESDYNLFNQQKINLEKQIQVEQYYVDKHNLILNEIDLANKKHNDGSSSGGVDKNLLATVRANIEAELELALAALEKEKIGEKNFEEERYKLRVEANRKIQVLYSKGITDELKQYVHGTTELAKAQKQRGILDQQHNQEQLKNQDKLIQQETQAEIAGIDRRLYSNEEFEKMSYEITKKGLERRLELWDGWEGKTEEILKEQAANELKYIKQQNQEYERQAKKAEDDYQKLRDNLLKLREAMYSVLTAENISYGDKQNDALDQYSQKQGMLSITKGIKEDDLKKQLDKQKITQQEFDDQMLAIQAEYNTASEQLDKDYYDYLELLARQHALNEKQIYHDMAASGMEDAQEVLTTFADSIQDSVFAATLDGFNDMSSNFISSFQNIWPALDELQKSLNDIEGVDFTDKLKQLTAIGKLSAVVFSGMGNMLSGIADEQDTSNREGFESAKKLNIAAATMSMIGGIVDSLAGIPQYVAMFAPLGMGAPAAGTAFGSALAATVAAMGAANIAQIASLKFDGSSSGASTSVNTGALSTIAAPISYTADVNSTTEDEMDQSKYVVSVQEINTVLKRVNVAESDATF